MISSWPHCTLVCIGAQPNLMMMMMMMLMMCCCVLACAASPAAELLPHNIHQALLRCQVQVEVHHSARTAQHLQTHTTAAKCFSITHVTPVCCMYSSCMQSSDC
jgi:hypothetical protein